MNVSRHQVEAYFFGNPEIIGMKILFIKRDKRLAEYKRYLADVREFGNVWHGITGSLHGQPVSIIATGIGPSLTGDAVYALNRPDAVCLYSGTCGGLQESSEIGDYFIAEQAVCGDGYSAHFGHSPLSRVAGDLELLKSLKNHLATKVDRVGTGVTFTTSSVAREVDDDFWKIVDQQCRVIEMATAAFYAAALATRNRAAAYFWVTDLPLRGKSFFEPLEPKDIRTRQDRYDRAVSLDLELLSCL